MTLASGRTVCVKWDSRPLPPKRSTKVVQSPNSLRSAVLKASFQRRFCPINGSGAFAGKCAFQKVRELVCTAEGVFRAQRQAKDISKEFLHIVGGLNGFIILFHLFKGQHPCLIRVFGIGVFVLEEAISMTIIYVVCRVKNIKLHNILRLIGRAVSRL